MLPLNDAISPEDVVMDPPAISLHAVILVIPLNVLLVNKRFL